MSWWISLNDPEFEEPVEVARFQAGGTQVMGGTTEADLNVTYNYGKHFDFRGLHERRAQDTIPDLGMTIEQLGDDTDPDYWKPTEGNVRQALIILLSWAEEHPDAVWRVN